MCFHSGAMRSSKIRLPGLGALGRIACAGLTCSDLAQTITETAVVQTTAASVPRTMDGMCGTSSILPI